MGQMVKTQSRSYVWDFPYAVLHLKSWGVKTSLNQQLKFTAVVRGFQPPCNIWPHASPQLLLSPA